MKKQREKKTQAYHSHIMFLHLSLTIGQFTIVFKLTI